MTSMPTGNGIRGRRLRIWLAPGLIFIILAGLTLLVWSKLIRQQRALVRQRRK